MKGRNLLFDSCFSSSALVSIVKTSPAIRDNCLFVFYREISILPLKAIATNSFAFLLPGDNLSCFRKSSYQPEPYRHAVQVDVAEVSLLRRWAHVRGP